MKTHRPLICWFIMVFVFVTLASCTKKNSVQDQNPDLILNKAGIGKEMVIIPYRLDSTYMEIIAIKATDGSIRTAFNTCIPCSKIGEGYFTQVNDYLLCRSCGENEKFLIDKVGITDEGCYPVPIKQTQKSEEETKIIIPVQTLQEGKKLFKVWKKQPLI